MALVDVHVSRTRSTGRRRPARCCWSSTEACCRWWSRRWRAPWTCRPRRCDWHSTPPRCSARSPAAPACRWRPRRRTTPCRAGPRSSAPSRTGRATCPPNVTRVGGAQHRHRVRGPARPGGGVTCGGIVRTRPWHRHLVRGAVGIPGVGRPAEDAVVDDVGAVGVDRVVAVRCRPSSTCPGRW